MEKVYPKGFDWAFSFNTTVEWREDDIDYIATVGGYCSVYQNEFPVPPIGTVISLPLGEFKVVDAFVDVHSLSCTSTFYNLTPVNALRVANKKELAEVVLKMKKEWAIDNYRVFIMEGYLCDK